MFVSSFLIFLVSLFLLSCWGAWGRSESPVTNIYFYVYIYIEREIERKNERKKEKKKEKTKIGR